MDKNQKATIAATIAVVAGGTVKIIRTMRAERKARQEIEVDSRLTIQAIRTAKDRVIEKIENGEYRTMDLDAMMDDFKFYQMTARYDED